MIEKNRQFVVFLKDAGTSRITRHRVKAPDPDLAARSFSDRGLHTLGAEELWLHQTKRLGIALGIVFIAAMAIYGLVEAANSISFYYL